MERLFGALALGDVGCDHEHGLDVVAFALDWIDAREPPRRAGRRELERSRASAREDLTDSFFIAFAVRLLEVLVDAGTGDFLDVEVGEGVVDEENRAFGVEDHDDVRRVLDERTKARFGVTKSVRCRRDGFTLESSDSLPGGG